MANVDRVGDIACQILGIYLFFAIKFTDSFSIIHYPDNIKMLI